MRGHADIRDGLRKFYVRTQRMIDRLGAPYGLSAARMVLMSYIAERDGVRSADIIKTFDLVPRTVTEAIDAMEADGHVVRRADPSDRRAKEAARQGRAGSGTDAWSVAGRAVAERAGAIRRPARQAQ
jgi:hypothetical protein